LVSFGAPYLNYFQKPSGKRLALAQLSITSSFFLEHAVVYYERQAAGSWCCAIYVMSARQTKHHEPHGWGSLELAGMTVDMFVGAKDFQ
jgi:hypothetical protein